MNVWLTSARTAGSAHLGSGAAVTIESDQRLGCFLASGQQHALRFDAPDGRRGKVCDDDHVPSDEVFGLEDLRNPGDDLARALLTDVDAQLQQLVGASTGSADSTRPDLSCTFWKSS